ncbi:Nudix family hydrolase [Candidatus Venteria ishoeyi]|uniref:Nudix family hydrolase n=1 Tax=Candidatus Venteria ishoeyi TaxID=1899563 RepID=UPI0025A532E6|nr:Nudix family hydrolase [Candidatus Venteria ishoeyi]MDM8544866.1 Nudix family hydrolase [Candidatus Venteria ishoeyi]
MQIELMHLIALVIGILFFSTWLTWRFATIACQQQLNKQINQGVKENQNLQDRITHNALINGIARYLLTQQMGEALNFTIAKIGKTLAVDRCYILTYYDRQRRFKLTHEWCASGVQSFLQELKNLPLSIDDYKHAHQALLQGEAFSCQQVSLLPEAASKLRTMLEVQSVQSFLLVPMMMPDGPVGCIGIDATQQERRWSQEDIETLSRIGELLAVAKTRQKMEQALRENEFRLKEAQRIGQTGHFYWNIHTEKGYWSEQVYHICGLPLDFEKNPLLKVLHFQDNQILQKSVLEAITQRRTVDCEVRLHPPDKSLRYAGLYLEVQYDGKQNPVTIAGTIQDLTASRQAEMDLRLARDEAARANRFKSEFITNMSHDIRMPMHTIIGMTHLALHSHLSNQQADYLNKIQQSAYHLLNIFNNLIDFSQTETQTLKLEHIDFRLDDMLNNLAQLLLPIVTKKQIQLQFSCTENVPRSLNGDPLRLGQILLNLIDTLLKFTPHQEKIQISTQLKQADEQQIVLQFIIKNKIIDSKLKPLKSLFDLFLSSQMQSGEHMTGAGLSMILSRRLIEMMGGETQAPTQQETAFCFSIVLQRAQQKLDKTQITANFNEKLPQHPHVQSHTYSDLDLSLEHCFEMEPDTNGSLHELQDDWQLKAITGAHVLLVEDNRVNEQVARELLEIAGLKVKSVNNGPEALRAIAEIPFHLVLMDIGLPDMDGYEITMRIRHDTRFQHLPIIATTAYALPEDIEKCLACGMNDHLAKPIRPKALKHILVRWIPPLHVLAHCKQFNDPAHSIPLPPQLPGINLQMALEEMPGESQTLCHLLQQFYQNHYAYLERLESAILWHDKPAIQTMTQQLEALTTKIGAQDLQQAARALQQHSQQTSQAISLEDVQWQTFANTFHTVFKSLRILLFSNHNGLKQTDLPQLLSERRHLHVVAGVVYNPQQQILLARRHHHQEQGGLWEFPGGKRETGEAPFSALQREFQEEIGIHIKQARPLIRIFHDYPEKSILLDVWQVEAWKGTAQGLEAQEIKWVAPTQLHYFNFPAANQPILRAIELPDRYLITPEPDSLYNIERFMQHLENSLKSGVRLVQLRSKYLSATDYQQYAERVFECCQTYQAKLLLNQILVEKDAVPAHGLHLNGQQLQQCDSRPIPESQYLSVSCHKLEDIYKANQLNADCLLLSPVKATASHPDASPIGWLHFMKWVEAAHCPVYALGGMQTKHIPIAWAHGGQGIAAIRGLWNGEA